MKRSFRVATAFTGAAAAALVPTAAHAATIARQGTTGITPADTFAFDCGDNGTPSQSPQWFHLYYSKKENHRLAACFENSSGSQIYTIGTGKKFAYYCAGQYSGNLWIKGEGEEPFTAGVHNLFKASVSKVQITGITAHPVSCASSGSVYPG